MRIRKTHISGKYMKLILFPVIILALSSCIDDKFQQAEEITAECEVLFSLRLPGDTSDGTRITKEYEHAIKDIVVLMFKPQGGTFEYMAVGKIDPVLNTSFSVTLRDGTFDIIVLANYTNWLAKSFPEGIEKGTSREDIDGILLANLKPEEYWNIKEGTPGFIPFYGEIKNEPVSAGMDVYLLRALASIDIEVTAANFEIEEIYYYNHPLAGYLIADLEKYNDWEPHISGDRELNPLLYIPDEAAREYKNEIYTFEAPAGSTADFRGNSCLVIGGKYNGENTSYYRLDFTEKNSDGTLKYMPLIRNYKYEVNIQAVNSRGWPTPGEAFNALSVDMEAEIVVWEQGFNEDIGIGANTFTLSQSSFTFPAWNDEEGVDFIGSIDVKSTQSWTYQVSAFPNWIGGNVEDWFTHSRQGNTNDDVIKFQIKENYTPKRAAYIHFKSGNLTHVATIQQRTGEYPNSYILKPGEQLEMPVKKAYLVWESDLLNGGSVLGDARETLSGPVTCELLWQDAPGLVDVRLNGDGDRGENTKLLVTANGATEGNAVIAIRVDGIIRYSWHIWVIDYDPEENTLLYNNGYQNYVFMDRNLGATTITPGELTTFGFLYQWGRKDPFPGANVVSIPELQSSKEHKPIYVGNSNTPSTDAIITLYPSNFNLPATLINPMNYYQGGNVNDYDWYATPQGSHNNYLWCDENGFKNLFDPCPAGWRVPDYTRNARTGAPQYSPWWWKAGENLWTSTTYGRILDGHFYPYTGIRYNESYSTMGRTGRYWAASPNGGTGLHLLIGSSINPSFSMARLYGFSVRCVQD